MLNELYHIATPWAKATKSQINMNRMLGVAANVLYPVYCAYVCFVDADDAVAPQYMEWLYLALRQSGEAVAICRDVRVNDFEKEAPFKALPEKMPETERMDLKRYTFWDKNGSLWCCKGMMKTEFLRDIRYDEELSIGEDALFITKVLLKAGGYIYLPCGLYAYYMRDGSALHQETFKPKQFSEITAWERIYALIREQRRPGEESMERTAEERLAVACSHVYPHIFIANIASIPLWIKTNLQWVAQRQSTVGLNSPSIFICCSFLWVKTELPKASYI